MPSPTITRDDLQMKNFSLLCLLLINGIACAQQEENYDYFADNRQLVRNGVQAVERDDKAVP